MKEMKTKYESPILELTEIESQDIVTASMVSNGKGSITVGDTTISGEEGTFSALFGELFGIVI